MYSGFDETPKTEPEQKYYWLVYERNGKHNAVTKYHPFEYIKSKNRKMMAHQKYCLVDWREITKEEYDLFQL